MGKGVITFYKLSKEDIRTKIFPRHTLAKEGTLVLTSNSVSLMTRVVYSLVQFKVQIVGVVQITLGRVGFVH